jgi:spore germination protein Q
MAYNPYQYGTFFQPSGTFLPPQQQGGFQQGGFQPGGQNVPGMLPLEQSYVENILRLNKGKIATIYMTFERNSEWKSKIFKGVIEAAGRDHIILSDPVTGTRYILLMVYLDYITFEGEINYLYPGSSNIAANNNQGDSSNLASYSPR